MRALAALLLILAVPASAASRPRVVLVTLDTTRADRMGFLGSRAGLTPALDALAAQGVVFERAHAAAPLTTVSHATILTGASPARHGVVDFGVPLPVSVPYLPEILRTAGYRTAAFVGALVLDPREGLAPGFDRGFETYDAGFGARLAGQDRYRTLERRGREVVARALRWLDGAGSGPFFLWVHLYDPHDPYEAELPFSRVAGRSAYDSEIASADAAVGTLLAALRARADWSDTLVVVCADHGESLGGHGEETHGVFLYDETMRVPLLVKRPAGRSAGRRVAARVGLVDVLPTILDEVGIAAPPTLSGRSLWPVLEAPRAEDRPACGETDYPSRSLGWSPLRSLRIDRFLFVEAPRRELYDQAADPGATKNVADERALVADRLAGERRRLCEDGARAEAVAPVDPDLAERLAALGYVGGGATGPRSTGVDPKDKIAVANALHAAIMAAESGDLARAVPLLERVVRTDPGIPMAQLQLGMARAKQRRWAEAMAPLHEAIARQPDSAVAHYTMAAALSETGKLETAARHYEIAVRLRPSWVDARFLLGRAYFRLSRPTDAIAALRTALALDPAHLHANLLLGRLLTKEGRPSEALPFLKRALAGGDSAEARAALAEAEKALGGP
jgi:arylsulfatase A-like enzyme/thioredoxin-like negative regulator of GroEL